MKELFTAVAGLNHGNVFANANKAADHFMAFGPKSGTVDPPHLQSGDRYRTEWLRAVGAALGRHGFMPALGYLAKWIH